MVHADTALLPDPPQVLCCPRCAGQMEKVGYADVTVDRCLDCGGMWFDALERERLKEMSGSADLDVGQPQVAAVVARPTTRRRCPVCRCPMIEITDHQHPNLRFEGCTVCYGAFFDAGEFRDYAETSVAEGVRRLFRWR